METNWFKTWFTLGIKRMAKKDEAQYKLTVYCEREYKNPVVVEIGLR